HFGGVRRVPRSLLLRRSRSSKTGGRDSLRGQQEAAAHCIISRPAVTAARMTSVVPITIAMWAQPSRRMQATEGPSPSAEIATSRPQLDASTRGALIRVNISVRLGTPVATLLRRHRATKTTAKTGIGTFAAVAATVRRENDHPTVSTRG